MREKEYVMDWANQVSTDEMRCMKAFIDRQTLASFVSMDEFDAVLRFYRAVCLEVTPS